MDKKLKTPAQKAQAAIEYIILLGVITAVVLVSFSRVMPGVNKSAEKFFNETANVIIGEDPTAVCTPGGWTAWSACPPCNGGFRTRACTDTCGVGCSGPGQEACDFVPCPPINGGWCPWGPCGGACGAAVAQNRSCNCPAPGFGGAACVGPTVQQCPPVPCPFGICTFDPWAPDPCPVLCGGAVQTRDCVCEPGAPPGATCLPDAFGTALTTVCNPQGCFCPGTTVDVTCGVNSTGGFDVYTIPFGDTPSNSPPQSVICPALCYGTLVYACVDGQWNYSTAQCAPSCSTGLRDGICDPGVPGPGEDGLTCPGDCCDAFTGCGVNNADPSLSCRSMCTPFGCQPYDWTDAATINSYCDTVAEVCVNWYTCGTETWVCGPTPGTWSPAGTTCICGDGFCHDMTNSGNLMEKCGDNCGPGCPGACPNDCSPCCGDGARNAAEQCDTADFGGETCVSRGYDAGFLLCLSTCVTDESNCCTVNAGSCALCGPCVCGVQNGVDNCGNACSVDCGACPFTCGSNGCEACETCSSCPGDCGPCCGNGSCDFSENNSTCPADCPPICGDTICTGPAEDCTWCYGDCGGCCKVQSNDPCVNDADCCTGACFGVCF